MVKVSKVAETSPAEAKAIITQIVEKIATPNGFAKLSPAQRRYLLAAILGSIVPVDGKVRPVELEHFENYLKTKYQFSNESLKVAMSFASSGLQPEGSQQAARYLPDLLSIEDRTNLVGALWDLALCDHELHANEDSLIYKIADQAGVPRKRVAEQQALAAGHHRG
jgi:uncharacterized tellurite resistance protein B-like protein